MNVEVNVQDRILKPVNEVFAAIVDPEHMSRYFISRGSAPMKAGTTVAWEFADVGATVSIEVTEVEQNRKIVYESDDDGVKSRTTITLEAVDAHTTVVQINEAGWPMDRQGVQRALGQTAGWTYFLCCLKAYLQFGINLRAGLVRRIAENA